MIKDKWCNDNVLKTLNFHVNKMDKNILTLKKYVIKKYKKN